MPLDPASQRRDYTLAGLSEDDLAPTWHAQLDRWWADAQGLLEPNAMVLATSGPSARTVLLKGYDDRGLVLYTNLTSRKAREIAADPAVSCVFPWYPLERQVVVVGRAEQVSREETSAYFRSRPRGSQIGAWVSHQSAPVTREALEARAAALAERWPDEVPVPDFWGGFRVVPTTVEFWQGRPSRLHDRLVYDVASGSVTRLSP